ncbi:cdc42 effector protein 3-like [Myripristis murdjan]|uniref:Cdc42 effector protein 3-like n=1 Tax=Myripristis murdjan TaxID=586833 RepID=A0A668A477_9TELE|nr:cdc42 effector protein 3-like [Myripristis murdjan]
MPLKTATYLKSATLRLSRKPKRRDLLISLPLGDFRHLSHIGLDARGDAFGDLSAFQRSGSLVLHGSQSHQDLFRSVTSDLTSAAPPKPPRLFDPEGTESPRSSTPTTGHKKCQSLPLLDATEHREKAPQVQEEVQVQEEKKNEVEEEEGLRMRTEISERDVSSDVAPAAVEEEPCFTLNLDLGPSILEEVLQVMDRNQQ